MESSRTKITVGLKEGIKKKEKDKCLIENDKPKLSLVDCAGKSKLIEASLYASSSSAMPNFMRFHHHVVLLLLLFSILLPSSFSEKSNGVCVSPGGRFHPFSSHGKPPRKARDLTLCRIFRRKTCCDASQTHNALLSVRKLATTGEGDHDCLHLWELLECSICDPRVGVQPGLPVICSSFCDRVFESCSTAYFSMNAKTQVISPCGVNDFVCGRASEWVSNGTDLCRAAGFAVKKFVDGVHGEEVSCYGGKASLDSIKDSWKESKSGNLRKDDSFGAPEDFQQWVREMPFRERVSWAVGGLVLTAGLLFICKRKKNCNQQPKQAAVFRTGTGRRLGSGTGHVAPSNQTKKR